MAWSTKPITFGPRWLVLPSSSPEAVLAWFFSPYHFVRAILPLVSHSHLRTNPPLPSLWVVSSHRVKEDSLPAQDLSSRLMGSAFFSWIKDFPNPCTPCPPLGTFRPCQILSFGYSAVAFRVGFFSRRTRGAFPTLPCICPNLIENMPDAPAG